MNPVQQAEQLLKRFEPLDLNGSLDLLYYLGKESDDIIFKDKATTPDALLTRLYSGYHPKRIQIRFWGGPRQSTWHHASLYAYILDRIARIIVDAGLQTAKRALKYGIKAAYGRS